MTLRPRRSKRQIVCSDFFKKSERIYFAAPPSQITRPRLFGLLGREENLTIPWQEIETIGTDAVLVHTQLPSAAPSKPGLWQSLRARLGL